MKVSEKSGAVFLLWVGIGIFIIATTAQIASKYFVNETTFANALFTLGFIYSLISIPPIAWFLGKYKMSKTPTWLFLVILIFATAILFCIDLFPEWFNDNLVFWLSRIILPNTASLSISLYFCSKL